MIIVVCSTCRVRIIPPALVSAGTLHCWYCLTPPPDVPPAEPCEEWDTPYLVEDNTTEETT